MSYYHESFEYDEYGNMNQERTFKRFFLESLSSLTTFALHHISNKIKEELEKDEEIVFYKNMESSLKKEHQNCPICFDDYTNISRIYKTKCNHYFHQTCIDKWLDYHKNCPICRNDL